jgi:hypothetical protein
VSRPCIALASLLTLRVVLATPLVLVFALPVPQSLSRLAGRGGLLRVLAVAAVNGARVPTDG